MRSFATILSILLVSTFAAQTFACCEMPEQNSASGKLPYNGQFKIDSKPEVWTPGSKICYSQVDSKNCATVTDMGEINLRFDGLTPEGTNELYVSQMSEADQQILATYSKFVVRYLALDGADKGSYIVQILSSILGSGSQAIYAYGSFTKSADGNLTITPLGYGDDPGNGIFAYLRIPSHDQDRIRIANNVISMWGALKGQMVTIAPNR